MIKQLRIELGMTQAQLAAALGVSQSTITHIETGKRSPSPALALEIVQIARKHRKKITLEALYAPSRNVNAT